MTELRALAAEYGFTACYTLPPEPFVHYLRRLHDGALHANGMRLCAEPQREQPWANAILLLIWPYSPRALSGGISGYYFASNESYHALAPLRTALEERGVRTERAYVPVRELLMRSGLGAPLLSGLTAMPPYGTRFAAHTLAALVPEPVFTESPPLPVPGCKGCLACARACPVGAIDESGFHFERCIRAYMEGEPMPQWVMEAMTTMLGCELCQFACPHNAEIPVNAACEAAFEPGRILAGDTAEALALVGRNMNRNAKLTQHAAVLAGKQRKTELLPALVQLCASKREAVRVAAEYAICLLSKS